MSNSPPPPQKYGEMRPCVLLHKRAKTRFCYPLCLFSSSPTDYPPYNFIRDHGPRPICVTYARHRPGWPMNSLPQANKRRQIRNSWVFLNFFHKQIDSSRCHGVLSGRTKRVSFVHQYDVYGIGLKLSWYFIIIDKKSNRYYQTRAGEGKGFFKRRYKVHRNYLIILLH